MKKKLPLLLLFVILTAIILSACGGGTTEIIEADNNGDESQNIKLTLWTFPVGNWGNPTTTASILTGFHKEHPDIEVSVEYLSYENGDARIEEAIRNGSAPDLILEGPERLVANWGDKGFMADLSDLWDSDTADMIYDNIKEACRHQNGTYYEFPICMTAHCMAINYDIFQETGALAYIDEDTHTWTTEGFIKAVQTLTDHGYHAGAIYCKNQSGDQGTRALVTNLYGGSFTDDAHTVYTIDSAENIKALKLLYDMDGITFEPEFSASDAVAQFCRKETAMCFCWNVSLEVQQTINNPNLDFEVFPMAFPSSSGDLELQGGIWGFGIFDNHDDARTEAAKAFIRYMTEDNTNYARAVLISSYWPVRDIDNIYVNDMLMTEYSIFMPYMGDYYQITPGWTDARAAWWQILQKVGEGTDISEAVKDFP